MGPPPIPRKEESMPNINPMDRHRAIEETSFVLIRVLLNVEIQKRERLADV